MSTPIVSINLLTVPRQEAWGCLECFPNEILSEIFRRVVGEDGPLWFGRLMQVNRSFHAFCGWTAKILEFPFTNEIKFTRADLNAAAKKGKVDSVTHLLEHTDIPADHEEDLKTLLKAIEGNQEDTVKLLLSKERFKKIDFNAIDYNHLAQSKHPLIKAIFCSDSMACCLWETRRFNSDPLLFTSACLFGRVELVKKLHKEPSINKRINYTGHLNLAIQKKEMEVAKFLLTTRQILIDRLGPFFKELGILNLFFSAVFGMGGIIAALVAGGILTSTMGIAAAFLTAIKVTAIVTGILTLSILSVFNVSAIFAIISHHLFILARAAAVIAYHHFKQKMAAKI